MVRDKKIVWLLGAGADIASGVPTVNLFLPVAYYIYVKDSHSAQCPILEELIFDRIEEYLRETQRFPDFLPSLETLSKLYDTSADFEVFVRPYITKMYECPTTEIPLSIYKDWKPPSRYFFSSDFGMSHDEDSDYPGPLWVRGMLKSSLRRLFHRIGEQFVYGRQGPWDSDEGYSILVNVFRCFPNIEDLLSAAHVVTRNIGPYENTEEAIKNNYHYFLTTSLIQSLMYKNFKGQYKNIAKIKNNAERIRTLLMDTLYLQQFREFGRGPYPVLANILKASRDTIINFNYTVFLERAFRKKKYSYLIDGNKNQKAIPLIKLHGSLGWYRCWRCLMKEFVGPNEIQVKPLEQYRTCNNCGFFTMEPFIIPPTAFKLMDDPDLFLLWNTAFERIAESDVIIVLGLSFSPTDLHFTNFFKTIVERNPGKKLLIIDPYETAITNLQYLNIVDKVDIKHIKEGAENLLKNIKPSKLKELSADAVWGEFAKVLYPM